MEYNTSTIIFGIIYVFIASIIFYFLSKLLGILFKGRNTKQEEEISRVVEESKTKEEDLIDDSELVAVISAAISSYTSLSNNKFIIKSIKESTIPIWSMIDRIGHNK